MQIFTEAREMTAAVKKWRASGKTVGLVPTMGYFHQGHLSLMRRAREENDVVVVSLFVNPLQFGPREDLDIYPRDFQRDRQLAEEVGVDCIFFPSVEEMYPQPFLTKVVVGKITEVMCGKARPGHFEGVTTVVAKLFHIIPADRAYFGQKDAQQVRVIQKMVEDLNFDIDIRICPTVREEDGLAASSRNVYLSGEERERATLLYRSLERAQRVIERGERRAEAVEKSIREMLEGQPGIDLEYVAVYNNIDLEPVEILQGEVLIALAAWVGGTRLIDNVLIRIDDK